EHAGGSDRRESSGARSRSLRRFPVRARKNGAPALLVGDREITKLDARGEQTEAHARTALAIELFDDARLPSEWTCERAYVRAAINRFFGRLWLGRGRRCGLGAHAFAATRRPLARACCDDRRALRRPHEHGQEPREHERRLAPRIERVLVKRLLAREAN